MHSLKNQSFPVRLRCAVTGIMEGLAEHSMRVHVLVLAIAVAGLIVLRAEALWWALLALSGSAVIATELVNTALEHLVDHLHPEIHPRIRIVKDCAAGAVLVASLGAACVGLAFLMHVLQR